MMTVDERALRQGAYRRMRRELRNGRMVRGTACPECQPLHGHHHKGYAPQNALDVVWLCATHHVAAHYKMEHPESPTETSLIAYHEAMIKTFLEQIRDSRRELRRLRQGEAT